MVEEVAQIAKYGSVHDSDDESQANALDINTHHVVVGSLENCTFIYTSFYIIHFVFFFFNNPPPPEISPLPLHAPLPICNTADNILRTAPLPCRQRKAAPAFAPPPSPTARRHDRPQDALPGPRHHSRRRRKRHIEGPDQLRRPRLFAVPAQGLHQGRGLYGLGAAAPRHRQDRKSVV